MYAHSTAQPASTSVGSPSAWPPKYAHANASAKVARTRALANVRYDAGAARRVREVRGAARVDDLAQHDRRRQRDERGPRA